MSGFWYEPERPAFFSAAGGEASLGEIYAAARDATIFVDNTFAAQAAKEAAYDRRIDRIFEATGERLDNPMRVLSGSFPGGSAIRDYAEGEHAFDRRMRDIAQRHPDRAADILPSTSLEEEALGLSRQAEERFTQLSGSRDGAGKWLALFAGGFSGSLRDPLQVAAFALGGGPGGARTVAGRILSTAMSEAAVNAGVELALQPVVQAYRAKAGLESGVDIALQNAAFAGLLGGVLGAGARGLGELLTVGGRTADKALAHAVDDMPPALRAEVEARLPETTAALREAMPLPARGALDQVEMIGHLDASRPASALPEHHDVTVSRAHQALDDAEGFPGFEPDPVQVARVTEAIAGPEPAPAPTNARSLNGFLIDHGGIAPDPDLTFIGADSYSERFRGRLVKDGGTQLDYAREAAAEAGYFNHLYGDPTTAVARSTPADLLNAIDEELRGNPVYPGGDLAALDARRNIEAERAGVESTVAAIARHAGPAVDDAVIREAAEISLRDGLEPFDALEQVFIRAESNEARAAAASARTGDLPPGWSDAELEAASASRGPEPAPENGAPFDDPGRRNEEFELSPAEAEEFADLAIPMDDGSVTPLSAHLADIAHGEELAAIVKACRV